MRERRPGSPSGEAPALLRAEWERVVSMMPASVRVAIPRVHPGRFPDQWARVTAADPAWPIHLVWFSGRWTILDGVHRVLKADMLGETTIPAMVLSGEDYQDIFYGEAGGVPGTASTFNQDSA